MSSKPKQLTVKELIDLLSAQDPTRLVWLEGCDCEQTAIGVSAEDWTSSGLGPVLLITSRPYAKRGE